MVVSLFLLATEGQADTQSQLDMLRKPEGAMHAKKCSEAAAVGQHHRTWMATEIYTPSTFAVYRANRDPALEAIPADVSEKKQTAKSDTVAHEVGSYTISTVAGSAERGSAGDGGPATAAKLNRPCSVAQDSGGSLYIADYGNHKIRKVTPEGTITTLAGTGLPGYAGDGGPAAQAQLRGPYGVCVDRQGNVYVADQQNHRIRRISIDGTITTVAGNGQRKFGGDGGPAIAASLAGPDAVATDEHGTLYIADSGNHRVRKVTSDGNITTVAGTDKGYSGDGGPAVRAQLNLPAALAFGPDGNLYVGDFHNHVVRKITSDGQISTMAGTGKRGFDGDDIPATQAKLNEPGGIGIALDGSLVIADGLNFRVRRVGADGIIRTIAGTGRKGFSGDGGPATKAALGVLDILAISSRGDIYITDHSNNRIRKLTPVAGKE
jgi:sugar lactone lactonase YvrE